MRLLLIPTMLLLGLMASQLASAQSRVYPPDFVEARAEVYKRVGDVELKLWIFDPASGDSDSRPAIVFFFGGGWKSGSPAQFHQHCRYLARQGMVAILADYRVRQRHGTLAEKSVADAKSAIRWVRQNADRLGVDPNRIVAAGGSAGGHLAACTGVIDGFDEPDEPSEVSSVPNAMALFNPAVVLAPYEGVEVSEEKQADLADRIGVPARQISPIHHLRSDLPPTIIFHGEDDPTVAFHAVRRYTEVNEELGNRCELVGYAGARHGFFNFGRGGVPGEHYLDTVSRLHEFLHSLGYVDGPPQGLLPESANVHLRSRFADSYAAIADRKQATVAFIGGSITEMKGYRAKLESWLQATFPDTKFEFVNAGISSTCSTTGAFRLFDDVLSHDPDLLLIEFAVNDDQDAAHSRQAAIRGLEGIVRQTLQDHPSTDMVITYFVNPPMLEKLSRGETPTSIEAHEAVASHYGVSSVNLAKEVAERIASGTMTWHEYGGTHPAEAGNALAAEMVQDLLETGWHQALEYGGEWQSVETRLPKKLDENSYDRGRFMALQSAECDGSWSVGKPDWAEIAGRLRARFDDAELLSASQPGAKLGLKFEGTAVGLYVLAGPDAGKVEFSVDGKWSGEVDLYHRFSEGLHYPRTVMLEDELSRGRHELELRIGPRGEGEKGGTAVRILAFGINGPPQKSANGEGHEAVEAEPARAASGD